MHYFSYTICMESKKNWPITVAISFSNRNSVNKLNSRKKNEGKTFGWILVSKLALREDFQKNMFHWVVKHFMLVPTNFWCCSSFKHNIVKTCSIIWFYVSTRALNVGKSFQHFMVSSSVTLKVGSDDCKTFYSVEKIWLNFQ